MAVSTSIGGSTSRRSVPARCCSWLNMVEIFFGIITRPAIRRGTFTSVKDLIAAIEAFIDGWNERCQPFIWTKTVNDTRMSDPLLPPD